MKYHPYKFGVALILNRLKWDLKYESWRSRKRLKKYQNKFKDQKAVILCNGPSLLDVDFSLLDGVFTFGLNKINLLFDKKNFRPSCIVSVNPHVIEQNKSFFNTTEIPLFLGNIAKKNINNKNATFLHSSFRKMFSENPEVSIYEGHTVTFVAMQLAFYFGFKEVALVGCDHNFVTKGRPNETVISGDTDPNHFDKNYFAGGVKWDLPDLFESEASYYMAKQVFEEKGRKIFNCTSEGKLEIYERMKLEDFVNS